MRGCLAFFTASQAASMSPFVQRARLATVHLETAAAMDGVQAGATQVECTVNGIGERAGNASLEEIVMGIHTRRDFYQAETGVNTKQIYRSSKLLSSITGVAIG